MKSSTKQIALTGIGIALFVIFTLCLQVPIFEKGKCVYKSPSLEEIKKYSKESIDKIWDEVKRFENPHTYYVDMSQKLWDIRYKLLSGMNCE